MGKRSSRIVIITGLLLVLLSSAGCAETTAFLSRLGGKTLLLYRTNAEYKSIRRLTYRKKHVFTHDDIVINSRVWEDPPFSIDVSKDRILFESDRMFLRRFTETTDGSRRMAEMTIVLKDKTAGNDGQPSLLSTAQSAVSQKQLFYRGVRRNKNSSFHVFKGRPLKAGGVKEIRLDTTTLLPVMIVNEGEDGQDEIQSFSDYGVNRVIARSSFKVGFPPETRKLVDDFSRLNHLPGFTMEDGTTDDFSFDLLYPSQIPHGYRLSRVEVWRNQTSRPVGDRTYELPLISFEFQNKQQGKKTAAGIVFDMQITDDERAFKAVSFALDGDDLNRPMLDVIASITYQGQLKEADLDSGKVFYWLSNGKVSDAVAQTEGNWLRISPASVRRNYFEDGLEEQLFLELAGSLVKVK